MKKNDAASASTAPHSLPLRPLGHVKSLIETIGLEVSYVYDDLVFVEHNAFLLQFSATRGEELALWFNSDCLPQERPKIFNRLSATAADMGLRIIDHGSFTLSAAEADQSLQLSFRPLVPNALQQKS
jgi:hypothetical protein